MKKVIVIVSVFLNFSAFSKIDETACVVAEAGIKENIEHFLAIKKNKKYQVVIGKLYKEKGIIYIKPENLWGEKIKNKLLPLVLLPDKKRYVNFKASIGFADSICRPDYSVNVGDRIVLFNSDIENSRIDLSFSTFTFYILDRKNSGDSQMANAEVDEKELIRQLDSAFGARVR